MLQVRDEYFELANPNFYERDLKVLQQKYSSPAKLKAEIDQLEYYKSNEFPKAKGEEGKERKINASNQ